MNLDIKKTFSIGVLFAFLGNTFGPLPGAQAEEFRLPAPGVMVHLSPPLELPILKGIKVYPDNPFRFDFILDRGDSPSFKEGETTGSMKQEAFKLIKYFLASITIPEKDLWVNLSPYEKNRIIPKSFGFTEMGRDLLAEDYMLKQITASLIYPEDEIGKKFWKRVYEEAAKKFGTTNIPVNTFNKVWIVPEKAVVYENAQAGTAYVVESKLKVMLEQDYLVLSKNTPHPDPPREGEGNSTFNSPPLVGGVRGGGINANAPRPNPPHEGEGINALGSQIIRAIVIPELTKEVNEDKNFAQLRQVYNSLILATWYKKKIKDSILAQIYADKKKVAGVGYENSVIASPKGEAISDTEKIYQRYLQAFKKGVFNYIKEDIDPVTQETTPKKYFSGGVDLAMTGKTDLAAGRVMTFVRWDPKRLLPLLVLGGSLLLVEVGCGAVPNAERLSLTPSRFSVSQLPPELTQGKVLLTPDEENKAASVANKENARVIIPDARTLSTILKAPNSRTPFGKKVTNDVLKRFAEAYIGLPLNHYLADTRFHLNVGAAREGEEEGFYYIPNQYGISKVYLGFGHGFSLVVDFWRLRFGNHEIDTELIAKGLRGLRMPKESGLFLDIDRFVRVGVGPVIVKSGKNNPRVGISLYLKYLGDKVRDKVRRDKARRDDRAQVSLENTTTGTAAKRGGIDFTANKTPLEIQNSSEAIKFHMDPAMLRQLQNASGFVPVIINIQPMTDLPQFLGLKDKFPQAQLARV